MGKESIMPKDRFSADQIAALLRQIDVLLIQGKSIEEACRVTSLSEESYYCLRKEYGDLDPDQPGRMKELEQENIRLRRLISELSLEKQALKDVASEYS